MPEFPGDHSGGATPVPIPNTEVKSSTPMVVVNPARVGRCPVFEILRLVSSLTIPACFFMFGFLCLEIFAEFLSSFGFIVRG